MTEVKRNIILRKKPPQFVQSVGVDKVLDGEAEWHVSQNLQFINKKLISRNYQWTLKENMIGATLRSLVVTSNGIPLLFALGVKRKTAIRRKLTESSSSWYLHIVDREDEQVDDEGVPHHDAGQGRPLNMLLLHGTPQIYLMKWWWQESKVRPGRDICRWRGQYQRRCRERPSWKRRRKRSWVAFSKTSSRCGCKTFFSRLRSRRWCYTGATGSSTVSTLLEKETAIKWNDLHVLIGNLMTYFKSNARESSQNTQGKDAK